MFDESFALMKLKSTGLYKMFLSPSIKFSNQFDKYMLST